MCEYVECYICDGVRRVIDMVILDTEHDGLELICKECELDLQSKGE